MSDWKDRATPVADDWKSRATPVTDANGNGSGPPGVDAMGTDNGPTTAAKGKDWVDRVRELPEQIHGLLEKTHNPMLAPLTVATNPAVQDLAGRGLDYAGGLIRTVGAWGAGALKKGDNPVSMQDGWDTLAGHAPGVGDYATRLGAPNPSVNIPYTNGKKLEAKDIENLVGNTLTNPLSYGLAQKFGRGLYNAPLQAVEVEGQRFGKSEIGDTYNKHGVWNEQQLPAKSQAIVDKNMGVTDAMEKQASDAGAQTSMKTAMQSAQEMVDHIKKTALPGSPEEAAANKMQRDIDRHTAIDAREVFHQAPEVTGIKTAREALPGEVKLIGPDGKFPGDPLTRYQGGAIADSKGPLPEPPPKPVPQKVQHRMDVKNAYDYTPPSPESVAAEAKVVAPPVEPAPTEPFIKSWQKPEGGWQAPQGTGDELPSLPVQGNFEQVPGPNVERTSQLKTNAYDAAKNNAYDQLRRSTPFQNFKKAQGAGLRAETEAAIEKTLGPEAAAEYRQANKETGQMLSTQKAQARVSNKAGRNMDMALSPVPDGTEGAVMAAVTGATGKLGHGMLAGALQKTLRGITLSRMPVGYVLRNTPQSLTNAGVVGSQVNPWIQPKGDN